MVRNNRRNDALWGAGGAARVGASAARGDDAPDVAHGARNQDRWCAEKEQRGHGNALQTTRQCCEPGMLPTPPHVARCKPAMGQGLSSKERKWRCENEKVSRLSRQTDFGFCKLGKCSGLRPAPRATPPAAECRACCASLGQRTWAAAGKLFLALASASDEDSAIHSCRRFRDDEKGVGDCGGSVASAGGAG